MKITSLKDACQVAKKLHSLGPRNVIITTLSLPLKDIPKEVHLESSTDESLYCFTSQVTSDGDMEQHLISFPTYEGYFTGTGDLFSSLIVARCIENTLIDVAYKAVCSVNAITRNTFIYQQYYREKWEKEAKPSKAKVVHKHELLLIQGKKFIEDPELGSKGRIKFIKIDQQ